MFAQEDFEQLADQLKTIQGRFLLSLNDVPGVVEKEHADIKAERNEWHKHHLLDMGPSPAWLIFIDETSKDQDDTAERPWSKGGPEKGGQKRGARKGGPEKGSQKRGERKSGYRALARAP